jgi:dihydropteroate synthase
MPQRKIYRLHLPTGILVLGKRTLLMGVLNITPDSFSDGGNFLTPDRAIKQALSPISSTSAQNRRVQVQQVSR